MGWIGLEVILRLCQLKVCYLVIKFKYRLGELINRLLSVSLWEKVSRFGVDCGLNIG